jgi:hypothetical protein
MLDNPDGWAPASPDDALSGFVAAGGLAFDKSFCGDNDLFLSYCPGKKI